MAGPMKTEDGIEFPAEAYAYVPDPESPSTWKLRLWETPEKKVTIAQLGRAAAALSPGGFRGNRVQIPDAAVDEVKRRIQAEYRKLGVDEKDMPESVRFRSEGATMLFQFDFVPEPMSVEKDAKIFEAGEYPDKEITISEDDLDGIIENFTEVPVKVEHTDSPLDPLGTVKRIWRRGKELFARLAFPSDLAAFLERRGIKKLSVALHKDPLRLAEVSLVLSPRVPSAAMFGQKAEVNGGDRDREKGSGNAPILPLTHSPIRSHGEVVICEMADQDKDAQIRELQFALRAKDVEAKLGELKAQGKVVPAAEAYAREILLQGDGKVTFGEGEATVAQLFECFLDAQPKVITFGELAPSVIGTTSTLTAEEEELLAKLGVTREQMQKYESG